MKDGIRVAELLRARRRSRLRTWAGSTAKRRLSSRVPEIGSLSLGVILSPSTSLPSGLSLSVEDRTGSAKDLLLR